MANSILKIGDSSANGQVRIVDEDRLCYIVESSSKGATAKNNSWWDFLRSIITVIEGTTHYKDAEGTKKLTFRDFYNGDGSVNEKTVELFVNNVLKHLPKEEAIQEDASKEAEE